MADMDGSGGARLDRLLSPFVERGCGGDADGGMKTMAEEAAESGSGRPEAWAHGRPEARAQLTEITPGVARFLTSHGASAAATAPPGPEVGEAAPPDTKMSFDDIIDEFAVIKEASTSNALNLARLNRQLAVTEERSIAAAEVAMEVVAMGSTIVDQAQRSLSPVPSPPPLIHESGSDGVGGSTTSPTREQLQDDVRAAVREELRAAVAGGGGAAGRGGGNNEWGPAEEGAGVGERAVHARLDRLEASLAGQMEQMQRSMQVAIQEATSPATQRTLDGAGQQRDHEKEDEAEERDGGREHANSIVAPEGVPPTHTRAPTEKEEVVVVGEGEEEEEEEEEETLRGRAAAKQSSPQYQLAKHAFEEGQWEMAATEYEAFVRIADASTDPCVGPALAGGSRALCLAVCAQEFVLPCTRSSLCVFCARRPFLSTGNVPPSCEPRLRPVCTCTSEEATQPFGAVASRRRPRGELRTAGRLRRSGGGDRAYPRALRSPQPERWRR
jgi:hypothetical protein